MLVGIGSIFGDTIWPIPDPDGNVIQAIESQIRSCEAERIPLRLRRRASVPEEVFEAERASAQESMAGAADAKTEMEYVELWRRVFNDEDDEDVVGDPGLGDYNNRIHSAFNPEAFDDEE